MSDAPAEPTPNADEQGGYMVFLPTLAVEDMTITEISGLMLPWMAPSCIAAHGRKDDTDEPALSLAMEWPMTWLRTVEPLPKFEHESLLLRRFSADQALATGRHAYGQLGDVPREVPNG